MPNINPQEKAVPRLPLTLVLHATQQSHSDHVVQPVVVLIACLKQHPQLQPAFRLRRPRRLQQDIRPIVRAEIVARVCAKDAGLGVGEAPICSKVQDLPYEICQLCLSALSKCFWLRYL